MQQMLRQILQEELFHLKMLEVLVEISVLLKMITTTLVEAEWQILELTEI